MSFFFFIQDCQHLHEATQTAEISATFLSCHDQNPKSRSLELSKKTFPTPIFLVQELAVSALPRRGQMSFFCAAFLGKVYRSAKEIKQNQSPFLDRSSILNT